MSKAPGRVGNRLRRASDEQVGQGVYVTTRRLGRTLTAMW
jgi:hypothetical protein